MAEELGPLADEREAGAQRKAAKRDQRAEIDELVTLMRQPAGRAFMWRLLHQVCRVHEVSFTGNSGTFFNEGIRNVGLRYLGLIRRHCFDAYQLMEREAATEQEARNGG